MNKLDKSKATGLDMISARLIRECADLICKPICEIFNQSAIQGVFSDDWKGARVTVVDKTRNMEHSGTFRNIPEHRIIMIIMTIICKIKFSKTEKDQQFGSGHAETI